MEINRLVCERWRNNAFPITKQESSCGRSRFRSSTDAQKRTPTFSERHWKGHWGKKNTLATLNISEVEIYSAFKTLNVIAGNAWDLWPHIRSMPYHDWHLVKDLVSVSPLISAVVRINILGVRLKVEHATHGISLFSIYTLAYMLNLKIWLVMPHTENIQAEEKRNLDTNGT